MTQELKQRAAPTEIRIGIGPALLIALTVIAMFGTGFGYLGSEISSLRSDMREDLGAMREDLAERAAGARTKMAEQDSADTNIRPVGSH